MTQNWPLVSRSMITGWIQYVRGLFFSLSAGKNDVTADAATTHAISSSLMFAMFAENKAPYNNTLLNTRKKNRFDLVSGLKT